MAKHCEVCGKTPVVGRILSHAHNVRARRFEPNLQRIRAVVNGGVRRIRVCTRLHQIQQGDKGGVVPGIGQ
jgi:large subunit ribosomal protein L28